MMRVMNWTPLLEFGPRSVEVVHGHSDVLEAVHAAR
jgi:hypothetical protein